MLGDDFPALEKPGVLGVLIANLDKFVKDNGYDGLEIDWKYPGGGADRSAFVALSEALRQTFPPPEYTLSADVPPWLGIRLLTAPHPAAGCQIPLPWFPFLGLRVFGRPTAIVKEQCLTVSNRNGVLFCSPTARRTAWRTYLLFCSACATAALYLNTP